MPARLQYICDEIESGTVVTTPIVRAAPSGRYGFGTIGLAKPDLMLKQAWRMVKRSGLDHVVDRDSARIETDEMNTVAWVEYTVRDDADLSAVPSRRRGE